MQQKSTFGAYMRISYLTFLTVTTAFLSACGGGGGSGSDSLVPANTDTTANLAKYVGVYKTGCTTQFIANGDIDSFVNTVEILADGNVKIRQEEFRAPLNISDPCAPTFMDLDVTVVGTALLPGTTKNITSATSTKTGTARLAEFTYTGFKLSRGSIGISIPTFGTKGNAGFLVEGNKVYVLRGSRKADGLPDSFSTTVLIKQ